MPRCPRCSGILSLEADGYERYYNCLSCAREFDFNMIPRRMMPAELKDRTGIDLTKNRKHKEERKK